MKPHEFVPEVNNVLKEAKTLLHNWIKAREVNQFHTQFTKDKKKARNILKKCENAYLIVSATNLNTNAQLLSETFKEYEDYIDKELAHIN